MKIGIIPDSVALKMLIEREKRRIESQYRTRLAACQASEKAALMAEMEKETQQTIRQLLEKNKGVANWTIMR